MIIKEIDFDSIESVRKKCIKFAKDGNTVVRPYKTLYSIENITHDIAHKSLYLEIVKGKESWEDTSYQLWEDLQVICIKNGLIHSSFDMNRFSEEIANYPYLGIEGFYRRLKESERNGCYINKVDIEVCILLGNTDLAKYYSEYREKQIKIREIKKQVENAERDRKIIEDEEKRLAKIEKIISGAENKIFHQENLNNINVDGKSIINRLMEKYGIDVPPRTKGWINSKLAMVIFSGGNISYRFYGKSQRDNSTVFRNYLVELENAINEELALPF